LETAKAAVRAGADILAHSVRERIVDDEFIQLLRSNNVIYVMQHSLSLNILKLAPLNQENWLI
jgi:hypothetical protein